MWWVIGALVFGGFGIAAFTGAPYLPILRRDYEPLLELTQLQPGQHLIDLGSGDGRLLRAAAAKGIRCTGYEINPVLWLISLLVCWRYRHLVTIKLGDFWLRRLPEADAIYVFLIQRLMTRLDQKLQREITRPTDVVSFVFEIPNQTAVRSNMNAKVYRYGK